jgi:hypothetical protein
MNVLMRKIWSKRAKWRAEDVVYLIDGIAFVLEMWRAVMKVALRPVAKFSGTP